MAAAKKPVGSASTPSDGAAHKPYVGALMVYTLTEADAMDIHRRRTARARLWKHTPDLLVGGLVWEEGDDAPMVVQRVSALHDKASGLDTAAGTLLLGDDSITVYVRSDKIDGPGSARWPDTAGE